MQSRLLLILSMTFSIAPAQKNMQNSCTSTALSNDQIKNIIDTERANRDDLPAPFPKYTWNVRRQDCYYVYSEYGMPSAFHKEHIFKLNQDGGLVDVQTGSDLTKSMKCPETVLTEGELAAIIKRARSERRDVPPPFARYNTRVERMRCLYVYYEQALPETKTNYHTFIIDPFGGLMEFFRGQQ